MTLNFRHHSVFSVQLIVACFASTSVFAQQPHSPRMPAPPPMRFVSRTERSQLDAAKDPKARLHEALDLAENHLLRAENFTTQKQFDEASEELGEYLGLIGDLRVFFGAMDHDKRSTRDLYRHFEIAVRAHLPRIAVMRRTTPVTYAVNLKDAEEYIKDTRAEALDSFYGNTVLREGPDKPSTREEPRESPQVVKHP